MRIDRFDMERTQCLYENSVAYNLSESGVEPLRVEELLGEGWGKAALLEQALKYPESNGSELLRQRIALLYPGATAENVLVTNGTSEANYTTLWGLLEKGDRAAVMLPTYMQAWGLARAWGRADAPQLTRRKASAGGGRSTSKSASGRPEAGPGSTWSPSHVPRRPC